MLLHRFARIKHGNVLSLVPQRQQIRIVRTAGLAAFSGRIDHNRRRGSPRIGIEKLAGSRLPEKPEKMPNTQDVSFGGPFMTRAPSRARTRYDARSEPALFIGRAPSRARIFVGCDFSRNIEQLLRGLYPWLMIC